MEQLPKKLKTIQGSFAVLGNKVNDIIDFLKPFDKLIGKNGISVLKDDEKVTISVGGNRTTTNASAGNDGADALTIVNNKPESYISGSSGSGSLWVVYGTVNRLVPTNITNELPSINSGQTAYVYVAANTTQQWPITVTGCSITASITQVSESSPSPNPASIIYYQLGNYTNTSGSYTYNNTGAGSIYVHSLVTGWTSVAGTGSMPPTLRSTYDYVWNR